MNVHRLRAPDDLPARFAAPSVEADPPEYESRARSWWAPLQVRLTMILSLVVAAMALAAFLVLRMPSVYTASTAIMIQAAPEKGRDGQAVATVENQILILTSATLAQRVIKSLNLERDQEFAGREQGDGVFGVLASLLGWRERVAATGLPHGAIDPLIVQRFASKLDVAVEGRSTVVRISFSANSPTKAARVANAITTLYLGSQTPHAAPGGDAADRLPQLAAQARSDETALAQYKASHPFPDTAPTSEQPSDPAQIKVAAANVAALEKKFRQLNSAYQSGGADAVAPLIASTKLTQLRGRFADLTRQEAELSTKYGDKHPQMIALKGERAEVNKRIDGEVRRHVQSVEGQLNAARAQLSVLEQTPATSTATPVAAGDERLQELERRATASRRVYEEAIAGGAGPKVEPAPSQLARLVEPAAMPRSPSSPHRLFFMGTTFAASLILSVLLAYWLERPRNAFLDEREMEAMTRVANLAVIPSARGGKGAVERVVRKPRSSFAEAMRALETGLQTLRSGQPKVLLVTSSIPNEGKTSVAVALGRLVARSGSRVILVDCDLRHPSVADQFAGQKSESGLADVLTGGCDLGLILRRDPISPLEFLPVAAPASNPAQLLTSQALKDLLEVLRRHYDLVILDAAPVLPVADTRMLSRLADKAVYVVEWNKTPREAVLSGIAMLRNAGTELAGTVLNKADMRRHAIYGYGFGGRGHRYGGRYYAE
jgi:capsular exopolysaccharide synthesis family protein